MLELNYALEHIMKGIDETVTEYGFRPEYPDGVFPPQLPIEKDGEKSVIMYRRKYGNSTCKYNKRSRYVITSR